MAAHVRAQDSAHTGQGQAVVTILSKHHTELAPNIARQQDLDVKVNGKDSSVSPAGCRCVARKTGWNWLNSIYSSARNLGRQFDEIKHFVQSLPPNTLLGIGYMEDGRAALAGPLSSDHAQVLENLHLPTGTSSSPYFCLSDLAKNWLRPSAKHGAKWFW